MPRENPADRSSTSVQCPSKAEFSQNYNKVKYNYGLPLGKNTTVMGFNYGKQYPMTTPSTGTRP